MRAVVLGKPGPLTRESDPVKVIRVRQGGGQDSLWSPQGPGPEFGRQHALKENRRLFRRKIRGVCPAPARHKISGAAKEVHLYSTQVQMTIVLIPH